MKNLLVATDFSERSDRALRRATLIARQTGAAINLVHVVDNDQPLWIVDSEREAAVRLLQEQSATLRDVDGVACEAHVVLGPAFAGIVKATKSIATDLLIIGPHRRRALLDIFVGTTAERTIRTVNCPVLMVNAPPTAPYGHILVTTDLSDVSRESIDIFDSLNISGEAKSTLLYVFHDPSLHLAMARTMRDDEKNPYFRSRFDLARRDLAKFLNSLTLKSRPALNQMVRHDDTLPAHQILLAAKESSTDLIVVGSRGRAGLEKLLLSSVAEEVLRRADRDVLAIPLRPTA